LAVSCKENKSSEKNEKIAVVNDDSVPNDSSNVLDESTPSNESTPPEFEHVIYNIQGPSNPYAIVDTYLRIKDALVADDSEKAKSVAKSAMPALSGFDVSGFDPEQQEKLKDILSKALDNAKIIAFASLKEQRENFKQLSIHVTDLIAITGTDSKLYQQFCPMYDKGSAWLSAEKDIKNPYYGSKMLTCGTVKKEIN